MLSVEVIHDPAAATVALDPIRSRILSHLSQPASAAMLALQLRVPRQKINYHLARARSARLGQSHRAAPVGRAHGAPPRGHSVLLYGLAFGDGRGGCRSRS